MERKTGFEPATLTLARWCFSSGQSTLIPRSAVCPPSFHHVHSVRRCSRALYYRRELPSLQGQADLDAAEDRQGALAATSTALTAWAWLTFGRPHVHEIVNLGPDPAISVHVYAPRLTAISAVSFGVGGAGFLLGW